MPRRTADANAESRAYSIRVVANETGISAETLRVWERRYGFPKPERRPGGGRLYGARDVARLQLVARALDAGYRPGDVMGLSDSDVARLIEARGPVASRSVEAPSRLLQVDALFWGVLPGVDALVEYLQRDEVVRLRSALRTLARSLGPKSFVTEIAHPFALRIGDAWECGSLEVRQEHLATSLLSTELQLLRTPFEDGEHHPVVVLATLPGEAHALGLEMVAVYLAAHRATTRLLGANTPPDEIAKAAHAMEADVVGVSVTMHEANVKRQLTELRRALRGKAQLWVGGAGASRLGAKTGGHHLTTSWAAVDAALASVRARA